MTSAAQNYPRDLRGYAGQPPHAQWPNQARIAVQFVLNYEEGAENHVLHGDAGSEQFLSDIIGAASYPDRHMSMDSLYEYGSRAGFWRIHQEFSRRGLPLTVFGVAMALARHPDIVAAIKAADYDVVSHGWRWIHYQHMDSDMEREHLHKAVHVLTDLFGKPPTGWYTGRDSPNTRRLVVEHGGFEYDSDYYGDDLPFWTEVPCGDGSRKPHLIVPYTLDANDMRFATAQGSIPLSSFIPTSKIVLMCCMKRGRCAEDDVYRHALSPAWPAGALPRPAAFPRLCPAARAGVGLYAPADRHALARSPSVPGIAVVPASPAQRRASSSG
jgi:allantoinase